ncbi:MAG: DUF2442 domain-containing protein [Candidatus Bipolaricaulota bacterium]
MALGRGQLPTLMDVRALEGCRLWLHYEDGVEGVVDLSHLAGRGIFRAWKQAEFFKAVRIAEHGALAWSEEIELCPDALYFRLVGKQPHDLLPGLRAVQSDT